MKIFVNQRRKVQPVQAIAEEIRDFTNGVRRQCTASATELAESERELRRVLRGVLPMTSRMVVTHPLRKASEEQKHAAGHAAATWLAFMREYVPESFGRVNLRRNTMRRGGGSR